MQEIILEKLKDYKIPILDIPFIDRVEEIIQILDWTERARAWTYVIYGPWGCGKSELMRALTHVTNKIEKYYTIYINLAKEQREEIIKTRDRDLKEIIKIISETAGTLGRIIELAYEFIRELAKKLKLYKKHLILIIDEAHRGALRRVEIIPSILEEELRKAIQDIEVEKISIILTTSEQTYVERIMKNEGKYITTLLTWNLDKTHAENLAQTLGISQNETKKIVEICDSSPRLIIDYKIIYRENIELLIGDLIDKVTTAIIEYIRKTEKTKEETIKELETYIENIDEIEYTKIYNTLLKHNIIIKLTQKTITKIPQEEHIGKRIAYQLKTYKKIIETITKQKTINITPKQVLKHFHTTPQKK